MVEFRSIYYARSREMMGTPRDRENMGRISRMFPTAQVKMVSRKECQEDAQMAKSMKPFFGIVDEVDAVVIDAHGYATAGVFSEAQHALHQGKPVLTLRTKGAERVEALHVTKNAGREKRQTGNWARIFSRKPE